MDLKLYFSQLHAHFFPMGKMFILIHIFPIGKNDPYTSAKFSPTVVDNLNVYLIYPNQQQLCFC